MSKSVLVIDMPNTCGECPFAIYTADEKRCIGYCNTSDEDYYCKALDQFMEYDKVDGGVDILGKPIDCPLEIFEPQEREPDFNVKEWLSSFNTNSATVCFTEIQELKKRVEKENE